MLTTLELIKSIPKSFLGAWKTPFVAIPSQAMVVMVKKLNLTKINISNAVRKDLETLWNLRPFAEKKPLDTQSPEAWWWCCTHLRWRKGVRGRRGLQLQKLKICRQGLFLCSSSGVEQTPICHGVRICCKQWESHASSFHWSEPVKYMKFLEEVLLTWIRKNYDSMKAMFINDSAPAHGSKRMQTHLKRGLPLFAHQKVWPPGSPELNPCHY